MLPRHGQSRARVIISSQPVNDAEHPAVIGLHILDRDPGGLLSIRIGDLGWASVMTIEAVLRSHLGPLLHTCTDDELDTISNAVRAARTSDLAGVARQTLASCNAAAIGDVRALSASLFVPPRRSVTARRRP